MLTATALGAATLSAYPYAPASGKAATPSRRDRRAVSKPAARHNAVAVAAVAPVNDACADSLVVTDGATPVTTIGAFTDGNPTPASCNATGSETINRDVWYDYIATCTGDATISICDADFDSKLAVHIGCGRCPPPAVPIGCDDDDGCGVVGGGSAVKVPAILGQCLTIRIGGAILDLRDSGTGTLNIRCDEPPGACCDGGTCLGTMTEAACMTAGGAWNAGEDCGTFACPPPVHDECATPIEVFTGIPFVGDSSGATGTDLTAGCASFDPLDVWHVWTADCNADVELSLCGAGTTFDSTLAVFDACGGSELACDDDGCNSKPGPSTLTVPNVSMGDTLFIRVAGAASAAAPGGDAGDYTLTITCLDEPRACCGTTGFCANLTPQRCLGFSATPQAAGVLCLGDADGNGTDDVCEKLAPDLDQNQDFDNADGDGNAATGVDFFHGAPTAVADLMLWLDRRFPASNIVASDISPTALVADLAGRMATNGRTISPHGHATPYVGTWIDDCRAGVRSYLNTNSLANVLNVSVETEPSFASVADHVAAGDAVTLLLGFYQVVTSGVVPDSGFVVTWRRTGGHYVTVADVDPVNLQVTLSDPDADAAEAGDPGFVRGGDHDHDGDGDPATSPAFRGGMYDHANHNAGGRASHDFYEAGPTQKTAPLGARPVPGGEWVLLASGDPLAYGGAMAGFHPVSSGGTFDVADSRFVSSAFLAANGYPDPISCGANCQTYTVVEAAVVLSAAAAQACCAPDGSCVDTPPTDCLEQGGSPRGPGTACRGDNNLSGADDVCDACPATSVFSAVPPDGTLDARQPHAVGSPLPRQGIGVAGPQGSGGLIEVLLNDPVAGAEGCFTLCETVPDELLGPNAVTGVTDLGGGRYRIGLEHAISTGSVADPGGVTKIGYSGANSVSFTAHPANVNGDATADGLDVTDLIDCCLRGNCDPPLGDEHCDLDRSGTVGPADLLRLIDLLGGGGGAFRPWMGTSRPTGTACP